MRKYVYQLTDALEDAKTAKEKVEAIEDIKFAIEDIKYSIDDYENTQKSTTDKDFEQYLNRELELLYEELAALQEAIR